VVLVLNVGPFNSNVASQTLYTVPANKSGAYRVAIYAVETTADGASSTLPNAGVGWTDADTSVALQANTVTPSNSANAIGAFGQGSEIMNVKAGSNITWLTSNYASGTPGAMNYTVRLRVEYLN
jgi:hypothetical protein